MDVSAWRWLMQSISVQLTTLLGHRRTMSSHAKLPTSCIFDDVRFLFESSPVIYKKVASDWGGEDVNTLARKAQDRPLWETAIKKP